MDWPTILSRVRLLKEQFDRSYKCLNIDRPTRDETLDKHIRILFERLEDIRIIFNTNYSRLTQSHKSAADNFFTDVRDKLITVLSKRGFEVDIPITLHEEVIYNLVSRDPIGKTVSHEQKQKIELDAETKNMTLSVTEFLGLSAKLIPEFDGKSEHLQAFIDALQLVDSIKETHEVVAVNVIKTKLKGTARTLISTEQTINAIVEKLKVSVKGESTEVRTAKILNVKQNNKSANQFIEELENLTKALTNAYISDGLSNPLAEKYSSQTAIKAMCRNASNERVKLVMEAGTFNNMNEAVSKFVNACTDNNTNTVSIMNYSSRRNRNNYGRGRGYSRGQNYNRGYNRSNNRGGSYNGRNSYNQRGRQQGHHQVRYAQGNQQDPQETLLGAQTNN